MSERVSRRCGSAIPESRRSEATFCSDLCQRRGAQSAAGGRRAAQDADRAAGVRRDSIADSLRTRESELFARWREERGS